MESFHIKEDALPCRIQIHLLISVSLIFSKFATLAITLADRAAPCDNLSRTNPAFSKISLILTAAKKKKKKQQSR